MDSMKVGLVLASWLPSPSSALSILTHECAQQLILPPVLTTRSNIVQCLGLVQLPCSFKGLADEFRLAGRSTWAMVLELMEVGPKGGPCSALQGACRPGLGCGKAGR